MKMGKHTVETRNICLKTRKHQCEEKKEKVGTKENISSNTGAPFVTNVNKNGKLNPDLRSKSM